MDRLKNLLPLLFVAAFAFGALVMADEYHVKCLFYNIETAEPEWQPAADQPVWYKVRDTLGTWTDWIYAGETATNGILTFEMDPDTIIEWGAMSLEEYEGDTLIYPCVQPWPDPVYDEISPGDHSAVFFYELIDDWQ